MENDLASDREISVESDVVGAGEIEMKSPDTKQYVTTLRFSQCIESFFDDHNMGFKHSEMRNCTGFLCSQRYEDYYRHQGVCPAVPPPPNPTRLHWKSPSQLKMYLTNSLPRMMSTTHPNNKDVASVLW
ncbi:hypothetical protein Bca4012_043948 [Brassica carinata]|uniref:(rape) hypothetical protein n=1 Tax=Brassica napus TaxID=3708 RepID=A0A816IZE7_BRANA|nr:unnamed protein product [Brassica napus]